MNFKNYPYLKICFMILNLYTLSAFAQSPENNYHDSWQKVENFEKKGLTTSAIAAVNIIYNQARKDKNEPQQIKSLLYKNKLSANLTEDATRKMIDTMQLEIESSSGAPRSILQNICAQLYQNYLAYNRYRLYSLTNTEGFVKEDIATWSFSDFQNKIASLYRASLQNEDLKKIPVGNFDAIIEKGNARYLRPTLFDLLAHRALDFFSSSENDVNKPAYTFEITGDNAFAPAAQFASINFESRDTGSFKLTALGIYQQLIAFHLRDIKPLIDVDMERLAFVNSQSVAPDKDLLYLHALLHIYSSYKDEEAAQAGYLAAVQMYRAQPGTTNKTDATTMIKAVELLESVVQTYPKSRGAVNAQNELESIRRPLLSAETEKVNSIEKPFRALVSFKNINSIYLRIIPVTKKQKKDISDEGTLEKQFQKIVSLSFIKEWHQVLPGTKDYLQHSTEIKIDHLSGGEYILLTGSSRDFSTNRDVMSANYLYVSDISFVNNGRNYFVLNRESGLPVTNATIKIIKREYNYRTRKYNQKSAGEAQTNQNGFFSIPKSIQDNNYNLLLNIVTPADHLYLDDEQRIYVYNPLSQKEAYKTQHEADLAEARIFYFTDRSIYRPGQTVYYKAIGVTRGLQSGKSELLRSSAPLQIILFNANGQKVDSAMVVPDAYGSFSGKFTLPQNQLTGIFKINCSEFTRGEASFSVEEYKRPKFFAEFEKAVTAYRLGDTVHITGKAEAYAGNPIDGAKVNYRVTRVARFPYPWKLWRRGFPNVAPLEITHGEMLSDETGNFKINFKAIPDLKIDPYTEPVFDYRITADVTDINGETRSANITVPVGYKALDLQIGITDKSSHLSNELHGFNVTAQNLSGEPQTVFSHIKLFKLKAPDRILRDRYWAEPDTFVMTKAAYIRDFPFDIYKDEDNPQTWETTAIIENTTDSLNGSLNVKIKKALESGWYKVEASSRDRYGSEVRDIKYFRVIAPGDKKATIPDYIFIQPDKSYEPGDVASIYASIPGNVFLIQQTDTTGNEGYDTVPVFRFYQLNNKVQSYSFQINEARRGGFGVMNFFVKHNRLYYTKSLINVPWSNKILDISFDTYREKTLPGSEETWKVTIAGHKKEKAAAEMLASMYDASLDQFKPHSWNKMNIWPSYNSVSSWSANQNFSSVQSRNFLPNTPYHTLTAKTYDRIEPLAGRWYGDAVVVTAMGISKRGRLQDYAAGEKELKMAAPTVSLDKEVASNMDLNTSLSQPMPPQPEEERPESPSPIRTNFNETAFFYPNLRTDENGNISFSFTMPEALTTWRLMAQAHTKDLAVGYAEKSVITQKDLMIIPNPPRFFREGDKMEFSAKVVNMTDKDIEATTTFHLLNAATMAPVDGWFQNTATKKPLSVPANQSRPVTFSIAIPKGFNDLVVYRIVATSGNQSDGEEAFIPVLTNRMLVTESMPVEMKQNGTKTFSFEKLLKSANSQTMTNYGLSVAYTPNPAWYALQALPYLNSYPYECTEQVFNRYFANALAMNIANSSPKLKAIFEQWKNADTAALLSNLQKNQELKSVLLEETPWVLQAKSEEQQKNSIALLFDIHNMTRQLDGAIKIVKERQSPNGGFVWFKGGPDDRYMTQYIVADIGHLRKLGAWPAGNNMDLNTMIAKAIPYLDKSIARDYQELKKSKVKLSDNNLSSIAIHYLYARSFFNAVPIAANAKEAHNYYMDQATKYWLQTGIYNQGMIALVLQRAGDNKTAHDIVKSLKENSITDPNLGMYWKAWNQRGWFWYQAPIESQSLMIEVFSEVANDQKSVTALKTWLLKNKQTNNWKTTRATAEAVYALLLQGDDWLSGDKDVQIKLGDMVFDSRNEKQEAGTGYFERKIDGSKVTPDMGNITVTVSQSGVKDENSSPSWGAVYWQYFEDLDKITFAETPLKLSKKLFVENNTDRGPVLTPLNDGELIHVGDKIQVRIELRADRDMEYVHMKDMRASTMEPVNVLSQYKWQGGLGYYESTKDASTNFFFSYLPKGTYVFEYPVFAGQSGDFSNGITTIQCMYAPEFTAHSQGVRVRVK